MSRLLLCLAALALVAVPVLSLHVSDFDSTVDALGDFAAALEAQEALEAHTDEHLSEEELAFLETAVDVEDNPSYTLPYPAVTYASHAAGGFFHPFSNVNPLQQPWAGFAPVAGASAAAVAATPFSAYHVALGLNTGLYPGSVAANSKGGYNVHGLSPHGAYGQYHPGLANDLTSLSGKAGAGGEAAGGEAAGGEAATFLEFPAASETHNSDNIEADADNTAYGLYPAPTATSVGNFARASSGALGPHKLQFEPVGENEVDEAFPALVEVDAEAEADSEGELAAEESIEEDVSALLEGDAEAEAADSANAEAQAEAELDVAAEDSELLEVSGDDEAKPENPTYVLPFPPVLPGQYTPLFNPYTNVNPLSTPFANYAAQPGAHPGVAAAAAAQAGALASINGHVAGAAGGYPYYPYAARNPVIAGQLAGNPVPFSGYAGWIHPQNLNSAAVGDNSEMTEGFPAFVEVATEETEATGCVGCSY